MNRDPAECEYCGKAYAEPYALKYHHKACLNIRPYMCETRGKSFVNKGALKEHLISHSGIKRYACSECDSRFAQKSGLKRHVDAIHRDEFLYQCQYCVSAFSQKDKRDSHERIPIGIQWSGFEWYSQREVSSASKPVFRG